MSSHALRLLGCVIFACAVAACGSSSVAGTPPGLAPAPGTAVTSEWATIVSGLDAPLTNRDATPCHRGEPSCLAAVVAEMEARLERRPCAHTAPFAFTYLEMTRGVAEQVDEFNDAALISIVDARFAQQYFDAFDNWDAGRVEDVPAAWQIAFTTADRQQASAALDLLLGMNAHISRDLAYIVAAAVADDPTLQEQPEDYLRVNNVIAEVKSPMLQNAAARFDPALFLLDTELPGDASPDPVALIGEWRAFSFDLGRRLALAETANDEAAVIAEIERVSAGAAAVLVSAEAATATGEIGAAIAGDSSGTIDFLDADRRLQFCQRDR